MDNSIRLNESQLSWLSIQLVEGEQLGWAAVEKRWHYLKHFAGPIFFILIWTGIPILILAVTLREMLNPTKQTAGLILVVLFPLAFIAIGGFLFYRIALIIFEGGPAIYAITDRRALIIEPGVPGRVHVFPPAQLRRLEKRNRSGGSGDILFTQSPPITGVMSQPFQPGFIDIYEVEQAWELLEQLAKTATEPVDDNAPPAAALDWQAVLNIVGKTYPKQARFLASGAASLAAFAFFALLATLAWRNGPGVFFGIISICLLSNGINQFIRFSRQNQAKGPANPPGMNLTPLALAPFQGVSDEQLARVRAAIASGEGLRWAGRPDPWQFALGRLAGKGIGGMMGRGAATTPLRLAPFGFGLILMGIFIGSACPGVLFLVIPGMLLIAASPLSEWLRARRTLYAVTDRRALTFEGSQAECVRAVNIETLPANFNAETSPRRDIPEVEFYGLPDADGLRRLMASIAAEARPSKI